MFIIMANTNFKANTTSYSNTDLINIINKKTPLAYLYTNYSGNLLLFPLIQSIPNLTTFYTSVSEGSGSGQLYIPNGSQVNYDFNDEGFLQILLLPNSGVKVFTSALYLGSCQLEAYNNSNSPVFVEPTGSSNSSIQLFNNTSGFFNNNSGSNGYTSV